MDGPEIILEDWAKENGVCSAFTHKKIDKKKDTHTKSSEILFLKCMG